MAIGSAHILVASLRGGDATSHHTFDLVRSLRGQGIDVRVFYEDQARDLPEEIDAVTSQARYADYTPSADLTIVQYAVWFHLADRLRDARGASIFWYHGVTPPALWGSDAGADYLEVAQLRTALAWHAHLAVAASPFTAQELHQHSGYPLARIRVVPLAVPVEEFAHAPDPATLDALRRRLHLTGKRVLIYIGRIAGNKRIDLLIEALALLRPTHPDLHLLIVGDTALNDAARQLTAQHRQLAAARQVAGQVTWTDRVAQVKPYLYLAALAVLPSRHEGFGVPLVEAMAAGVPVVAGAEGALPWVIGAGEPEDTPDAAAGLLFAPDNAADLARQIRRILDDPALRADLVRRGRLRAQRYTPDRLAVHVAQVVEEARGLAAAGRPPVPAAHQHPLFDYYDVALRGYQVNSGLPLVGRWVAAVRRAITSHVKEAYLDRIVERQVDYNSLLALEVARLQEEVRRLQAELAALRRDRAQAENRQDEHKQAKGNEDKTL